MQILHKLIVYTITRIDDLVLVRAPLDYSDVAVQGVPLAGRGAAPGEWPARTQQHNNRHVRRSQPTRVFYFFFSSGVGEPANYWRPNSPGLALGLVLWLA